VISGDMSWSGPYIHGLGVGDINGDGMFDIVERSGYWRHTATTPWERHGFSVVSVDVNGAACSTSSQANASTRIPRATPIPAPTTLRSSSGSS
jgi:hypothetical protein